MASKWLPFYHFFGIIWHVAYIFFLAGTIINLIVKRNDVVMDRWVQFYQFISIWAVLAQFMYFIHEFINDMKPDSEKVPSLYSEFYTGVLPLTFLVTCHFWPMYIFYRDLIDPQGVVVDFGTVFNHMTHTTTNVIALIELFLQDTPNISKFSMFWSTFNYFVIYRILVIVCTTLHGRFPYPFMDYLENAGLGEIYLLTSVVIGVCLVLAASYIKDYCLAIREKSDWFAAKLVK